MSNNPNSSSEEGQALTQKTSPIISEKEYHDLGIKKEPAAWEDGLRTSGGKGSFEWWYFDVECTDGTKIVTVFYTKDGFQARKHGNPTVTLNITLPDGQTIERKFSEGKGKPIRASKSGCDLQIGQSSVKVIDEEYVLCYEDEVVAYTCRMKSRLPMWRPRTGHIFFGKEQKHFFAWFVPLPCADVTATLRINEQTLQLKGKGYHDHNWGNVDMFRLINHWYWCRANIGPYTVIASDIIAAKKYGFARIPVFMLGQDGTILEDDSNKTIVRRSEIQHHPATGKFIDNHLTFIQPGKDGPVYTVEFIREHDILAMVVGDIPNKKLLKLLLKLKGLNPSYLRCVGTVRLTIDKDGEKEVFEKEGLWEQMFFGSEKDAKIG